MTGDCSGYGTRFLEQEVDHTAVATLDALYADLDEHLDRYLVDHDVDPAQYDAQDLVWDAIYAIDTPVDDPGLLEGMMPAIGGDRPDRDELTITGDALQATFYEESGTVWAYVRQTDNVADRPPADAFDAFTARDKALDTYLSQRCRDPQR